MWFAVKVGDYLMHLVTELTEDFAWHKSDGSWRRCGMRRVWGVWRAECGMWKLQGGVRHAACVILHTGYAIWWKVIICMVFMLRVSCYIILGNRSHTHTHTHRYIQSTVATPSWVARQPLLIAAQFAWVIILLAASQAATVNRYIVCQSRSKGNLYLFSNFN